MPASGYSQYQDPVTGKTIWLPQLYPHSRQIEGCTREEEENWVNTKAIPPDLYASHLNDLKKTEERSRKLENGEEILISDYSTVDEALKSCELIEYQLTNKARLYGENILIHIFYRFDKNEKNELEIHSRLNEIDPDIVWLSYVKEAITIISTSLDPLEIHFSAARKMLKEKYNIEDPGAIRPLSKLA